MCYQRSDNKSIFIENNSSKSGADLITLRYILIFSYCRGLNRAVPNRSNTNPKSNSDPNTNPNPHAIP